MPMFQITIIPITGKTNIGVSDYIAEIIQFLKESKADYTLTPTATVVNCDTIEECFATMYKMHTLLFDRHNLPRIITNIMIDDRRDIKATPQDKIRDVEDKLI
ncbi:MAG TPA: MTH1187 family thiamine-binding protein [Firmicutes bacterium]|uniref:Thiamine-binding protein n=1 Tax=candidate division TA06 bacterium TaxID=2250710 RepID=A0A660S9S0_UNCT6|nr:MTH1187 family thiamine-binding protein [candidate division WOR-3 bacterium]RKX67224.1 MAG: thiamine-binding protein [candidate division TA06 bacterium]HFD05217.1 MTH1187 family thiamine-binding protein [Bacillota bacterium]